MTATTIVKRCTHGWSEAWLRAELHKAEVHLRACIADTTHPFRRGFIDGARKACDTIRGHIEEVK